MGDPLLDQLPRAYRIGLRLQILGASHDLIADCLELDPESVITLLEIGARKLERARNESTANNTEISEEQPEGVPPVCSEMPPKKSVLGTEGSRGTIP